MRRMKAAITRKGIISRLHHFASEYASRLEDPGTARSGLVALMGATSFVEALLGLHPSQILRPVSEVFIRDLPSEVPQEERDRLILIVEHLIQASRTGDFERLEKDFEN